MSELQPEELLLTVAATIGKEEMETMISNSQLAELLDDNCRKEAKIIELERRIVDIHRHYAKRLGD